VSYQCDIKKIHQSLYYLYHIAKEEQFEGQERQQTYVSRLGARPTQQALAPKILKFLPKIIGSHTLLNPFWGVSYFEILKL
jgi:hypothetical protein